MAVGLGASPGAASGEVVFDADEAERLGKAGKDVILVREQTKPEDIHGFFAAKGILTSVGGKTSHAAVVARGMGKPCVSGASDIKISHSEAIALCRGKPHYSRHSCHDRWYIWQSLAWRNSDGGTRNFRKYEYDFEVG